MYVILSYVMRVPLKILISGDMGESIPPPYTGIMKRCLLHAGQWKAGGASVFMHIHHRHDREDDMGGGATYFYDFDKKPDIFSRLLFLLKNFFADPQLFFAILNLEIKLSPDRDWSLMSYCAGRAVVLDRAIRKYTPDVIITETGGLQSLVSLYVGKRHNLPVVLENYAEILFKAKEGQKNIAPLYAPLWKYLVNGADLVVSGSKHCAKGPENYIEDNLKIRIIYSGINFDVFNGKVYADKKKARIKFDLPQDKYLVMAVGAFKMRKGHDHLFDALLMLSLEERKNITVVLCGVGDVSEVKARAREAGFPDESLRIFQGLSENDLAELYSAVDCFCFPSVTPRECMGLALKEAMAIGLPVAAYDSGGISEAVTDGQNGILAKTGDKHALAQAILRVSRMPQEEREQIRLKNIEKSGRLFDIKITSLQLLDELTRLTT